MEISVSARPDSSSLVSIQALRAIAALLVFLGHAINQVNLEVAKDFPNSYGPFGVDLFFVISGFVMVYSSERLFGQPGAPIKFFARRLARIVPLYWAATAILVWFDVPNASTKAVLSSLFFVPHIPSEAPLLVVGWTLIFEMFFYAVFAIALLAKRRFAVVAGATIFLISFVVLGPAPSDAEFWYPPASSSIAYLADPIIMEFVFGMMIALAYRAGVRLPIWGTIILIIVAFIWFAATIPWVPRPYSAGIVAALIVAGMSLSSMSSPKGSALICGVMFLGDISYSLYLTHLLSFNFVDWIVARMPDPALHAANLPPGVALVFGVMIATGLVIAVGTYLMLEKPTTNVLKRLLERARLPVNSATKYSVVPQIGLALRNRGSGFLFPYHVPGLMTSMARTSAWRAGFRGPWRKSLLREEGAKESRGSAGAKTFRKHHLERTESLDPPGWRLNGCYSVMQDNILSKTGHR